MKLFFLFPAWFFAVSNLVAQTKTPSDADAAAAGVGSAACCGSFLFVIIFIIAVFVLNIALLIWVAKDAKARGMDSSVVWMILVMFTSVLGLIIYLFARPQGNLVQCPSCKNKRLQASAKCPHCGNA